MKYTCRFPPSSTDRAGRPKDRKVVKSEQVTEASRAERTWGWSQSLVKSRGSSQLESLKTLDCCVLCAGAVGSGGGGGGAGGECRGEAGSG